MNELKSVSKSDTELRVANYMILFGGKDLAGEFFTRETEFKSAYTNAGVLHVDFEHGLDPDRVGMKAHDVLGYVDWSTAKIDETGIFVERVLSRQARYMSSIETLIEAKSLGTSSQCTPRASERKSSGEITRWPLMRDSLTFTPCEPRMLGDNVVESVNELKSFFPDSKSLTLSPRPNFEELKTVRDLERLLRDEFGCSNSVACNFLSHAKRILSGDLTKHEQQIGELKNRLAQKEVESFLNTLSKVKIP